MEHRDFVEPRNYSVWYFKWWIHVTIHLPKLID